MVLAELGSKVAVALRKMTQATVVGAPNIAPHMLSKLSLSHFFSHRVLLSTDQTVMNDMLQEICKALLQADVNVAAVKKMREAIKNNDDVEALAGGLNKRKMLDAKYRAKVKPSMDGRIRTKVHSPTRAHPTPKHPTLWV